MRDSYDVCAIGGGPGRPGGGGFPRPLRAVGAGGRGAGAGRAGSPPMWRSRRGSPSRWRPRRCPPSIRQWRATCGSATTGWSSSRPIRCSPSSGATAANPSRSSGTRSGRASGSPGSRRRTPPPSPNSSPNSGLSPDSCGGCFGNRPLQLDSSFADALPAAFARGGSAASGSPACCRRCPMAVRDLLDDRFETGALKAALAAPALTGTRLGPRAPGTRRPLPPLPRLRAAGAARLDPAPRAAAPPRSEGRSGRRRAPPERTSRRPSGGVRRILVEPGGKGGRAAGVELADGRTVRCGAVLSDASPPEDAPGVDRRGAARTRVRPRGAPHPLPGGRRRGSASRSRGFPGSAIAPPGEPPESDPRLGGILQIGGSLDEIERAADAAKYGRDRRPRRWSSPSCPRSTPAGSRPPEKRCWRRRCRPFRTRAGQIRTASSR